jgi:succinyl-diaminopimelate desuccinylase
VSVVALAQELVRLDTVNPPGQEEAAARLAIDRLTAAGLSVDVIELAPGRPNVVARWPGDGDAPALCLTGHLDTVPFGQASWSREPLGAEVDGDRLYGRGTSDMKGGVAAVLVAAEAAAAAGRGRAGLEVVLCAGEETGCEGALALAGADGALGRVGAVLVAEPTANVPCVAHKGVVWLEAVALGRTAHGSMPELGDNAVAKLARGIVALDGFAFEGVEAHALLGSPTLNVGRVAGGMNVNSVPDRAVAGLDVRTVPELSCADVVDALRAVMGEDVALEPWLDLPPIDTDPDDGWVRSVFAVMGERLDCTVEARGLAYFTDAAALSPAYGSPPTIICGPGEAAQAHQTDESCSVAALEVAADGFTEIARRWCGV